MRRKDFIVECEDHGTLLETNSYNRAKEKRNFHREFSHGYDGTDVEIREP